MTKLKALIATMILGSSSLALAQATVRAGATVQWGTPAPARTRPAPPPPPAPAPVVVRDRRPSSAYIKFDDYDARYDKVERFNGRPVTGTYNSNYGVVRLSQNGNRVNGTYETGGGGIIKGHVSNGVLYYRWKQAGSEGHGVWFMNGKNNQITGTWGTYDSQDNSGQWNLTRNAPQRGRGR